MTWFQTSRPQEKWVVRGGVNPNLPLGDSEENRADHVVHFSSSLLGISSLHLSSKAPALSPLTLGCLDGLEEELSTALQAGQCILY